MSHVSFQSLILRKVNPRFLIAALEKLRGYIATTETRRETLKLICNFRAYFIIYPNFYLYVVLHLLTLLNIVFKNSYGEGSC